MNDKGEKTCPLCAEEMDLTDQHLKPCKCGYQICVWCWNHIIEMAEKDKTEGRCPACRSPYDKEKIVGMTVSSERLVAELNIDRKKSQKVKPKSLEARKDLTGVRVIQRNLVYVMSLPFELADEDLLQRKEYFAQYGKILKVAMARTTAGAVQQFPYNTCSVYITYSKEDEAIRCIRSVHGFVLDGRPLKACFGTMKYCHAWLRNTACTNAECLYLHEIGSEEDSFAKDETITLHMRKMVQQITGAADYFQQRSGSMLPPPVNDYVDHESSSRKMLINNAHSVVKSSPANCSNSRPTTLPAGAMWGMHSSSQSSVPNTPRSSEPGRDKTVTVSSAVATNSTLISAGHSDVLKKPALEDNYTADGDVLKTQSLWDGQIDFPELSLSNKTQISNSTALASASVDISRSVSVPPDCTDFPEHTSQLSNGTKMINRRTQSVGSDVVSVDADSAVDGIPGITRSECSHFDHDSIKSSHTEMSQDSLQCCVNEPSEVQPSEKSGRNNANEVVVSREEVNAGTSLMSPLVTDNYPEPDDDISLFNRQRLEDPEFLSCHPNGLLRTSSFMQPCSSQYTSEHDETRPVFGSSYSDNRGRNIAPISHGYMEVPPLTEPSRLNGSLSHSILRPDRARHIQPSIDSQGNYRSEIDDRIIANMSSLDIDSYLALPHDFTKRLGAGDEVARSLNLASSSSVKNNQSRFSFARQEDQSMDQAFESYNIFNHNFSEPQNPDIDMHRMYNGPSSSYFNGIDYVTQSSTMPSSYRPPSVPRYPVLAPPGFSVPSRPPPPPPGFSSSFNGFSGNHRFPDQYQPHPIENTGGGVRDIQFMDPAILAVQNGNLDFRSNFQGNRNIYGNETNLQQQQVVTQSPLSSYQNYRFNNSLGMAPPSPSPSSSSSSSIIDQSRNMGLPNGHWNGLSNERLGGMPDYNGTYRI